MHDELVGYLPLLMISLLLVTCQLSLISLFQIYKMWTER